MIITAQEKRILDNWGRDILIHIINNSRHKNHNELKKFIREELSHQEVMNILATGKVVLEYRSTVQSIKNTEKVEQSIKPFLALPLFMMFKQHIWNKIITNIPLIGSLGFAGQIASIMAGGAVGGMISGIIYSLIRRIVTERIRRSNDNCNHICNSKISKDVPLRKWKVPVCAAKCRITDLNKYISVLRTEQNKCSETDNPDMCKHSILTQIIKTQKMLQNEMKHFEKVQAKLNKKFKLKRSPLMPTRPS